MRQVKSNEGFNPCPLCGTTEHMLITDRDSFYEEAEKEKGSYELVHLECYGCCLQIYSHRCEGHGYKAHYKFLQEQWNKLREKDDD